MLDIETALGQLFLDPVFCELQDNFQSKQRTYVADIVNGQCYQELRNTGYCESPSNVTLTLNIDGVTIFRNARSGSLWPVYLTVDELSAKLSLKNLQFKLFFSLL
jgi:hypothetical protein